MLVSIKHDDSIGQGKAGIAIGKWGAITILKKQRPHLYQCSSLANQTFTTNPLANAGYTGGLPATKPPTSCQLPNRSCSLYGKLAVVALSILRRQQLGPSVGAIKTLQSNEPGMLGSGPATQLTLQCSVNASSNLWITGASPGKRKASR